MKVMNIDNVGIGRIRGMDLCSQIPFDVPQTSQTSHLEGFSPTQNGVQTANTYNQEDVEVPFVDVHSAMEIETQRRVLEEKYERLKALERTVEYMQANGMHYSGMSAGTTSSPQRYHNQGVQHTGITPQENWSTNQSYGITMQAEHAPSGFGQVLDSQERIRTAENPPSVHYNLSNSNGLSLHGQTAFNSTAHATTNTNSLDSHATWSSTVTAPTAAENTGMTFQTPTGYCSTVPAFQTTQSTFSQRMTTNVSAPSVVSIPPASTHAWQSQTQSSRVSNSYATVHHRFPSQPISNPEMTPSFRPHLPSGQYPRKMRGTSVTPPIFPTVYRYIFPSQGQPKVSQHERASQCRPFPEIMRNPAPPQGNPLTNFRPISSMPSGHGAASIPSAGNPPFVISAPTVTATRQLNQTQSSRPIQPLRPARFVWSSASSRQPECNATSFTSTTSQMIVPRPSTATHVINTTRPNAKPFKIPLPAPTKAHAPSKTSRSQAETSNSSKAGISHHSWEWIKSPQVPHTFADERNDNENSNFWVPDPEVWRQEQQRRKISMENTQGTLSENCSSKRTTCTRLETVGFIQTMSDERRVTEFEDLDSPILSQYLNSNNARAGICSTTNIRFSVVQVQNDGSEVAGTASSPNAAAMHMDKPEYTPSCGKSEQFQAAQDLTLPQSTIPVAHTICTIRDPNCPADNTPSNTGSTISNSPVSSHKNIVSHESFKEEACVFGDSSKTPAGQVSEPQILSVFSLNSNLVESAVAMESEGSEEMPTEPTVNWDDSDDDGDCSTLYICEVESPRKTGSQSAAGIANAQGEVSSDKHDDNCEEKSQPTAKGKVVKCSSPPNRKDADVVSGDKRSTIYISEDDSPGRHDSEQKVLQGPRKMDIKVERQPRVIWEKETSVKSSGKDETAKHTEQDFQRVGVIRSLSDEDNVIPVALCNQTLPSTPTKDVLHPTKLNGTKAMESMNKCAKETEARENLEISDDEEDVSPNICEEFTLKDFWNGKCQTGNPGNGKREILENRKSNPKHSDKEHVERPGGPPSVQKRNKISNKRHSAKLSKRETDLLYLTIQNTKESLRQEDSHRGETVISNFHCSTTDENGTSHDIPMAEQGNKRGDSRAPSFDQSKHPLLEATIRKVQGSLHAENTGKVLCSKDNENGALPEVKVNRDKQSRTQFLADLPIAGEVRTKKVPKLKIKRTISYESGFEPDDASLKSRSVQDYAHVSRHKDGNRTTKKRKTKRPKDPSSNTKLKPSGLLKQWLTSAPSLDADTVRSPNKATSKSQPNHHGLQNGVGSEFEKETLKKTDSPRQKPNTSLDVRTSRPGHFAPDKSVHVAEPSEVAQTMLTPVATCSPSPTHVISDTENTKSHRFQKQEGSDINRDPRKKYLRKISLENDQKKDTPRAEPESHTPTEKKPNSYLEDLSDISDHEDAVSRSTVNTSTMLKSPTCQIQNSMMSILAMQSGLIKPRSNNGASTVRVSTPNNSDDEIPSQRPEKFLPTSSEQWEEPPPQSIESIDDSAFNTALANVLPNLGYEDKFDDSDLPDDDSGISGEYQDKITPLNRIHRDYVGDKHFRRWSTESEEASWPFVHTDDNSFTEKVHDDEMDSGVDEMFRKLHSRSSSSEDSLSHGANGDSRVTKRELQQCRLDQDLTEMPKVTAAHDSMCKLPGDSNRKNSSDSIHAKSPSSRKKKDENKRDFDRKRKRSKEDCKYHTKKYKKSIKSGGKMRKDSIDGAKVPRPKLTHATAGHSSANKSVNDPSRKKNRRLIYSSGSSEDEATSRPHARQTGFHTQKRKLEEPRSKSKSQPSSKKVRFNTNTDVVKFKTPMSRSEENTTVSKQKRLENKNLHSKHRARMGNWKSKDFSVVKPKMPLIFQPSIKAIAPMSRADRERNMSMAMQCLFALGVIRNEELEEPNTAVDVTRLESLFNEHKVAIMERKIEQERHKEAENEAGAFEDPDSLFKARLCYSEEELLRDFREAKQRKLFTTDEPSTSETFSSQLESRQKADLLDQNQAAKSTKLPDVKKVSAPQTSGNELEPKQNNDAEKASVPALPPITKKGKYRLPNGKKVRWFTREVVPIRDCTVKIRKTNITKKTIKIHRNR